MLKLEDLKPGLPLVGLEPSVVATVAAVVPIGDGAVQVIYRTPDGTMKERLLGRADEASIGLATAERPWSFDGDGAAFQLACEAKRIDLAFLFDPMMAVHTSNVEPLPHQITAVYESMLPRQPLRFVLADDPGAGKTIMAGPLHPRAHHAGRRPPHPDRRARQPGRAVARRAVREVRAGVPHLLAAARSSLAQRQSVRGPSTSSSSGSTRCRATRSCRKALRTPAGTWSSSTKPTSSPPTSSARSSRRPAASASRRSSAQHTRHLLLMTATPHNGKEEDFQLFLSLLDSDRFYGKFRDGVHKVDASDLMRRMVKEELVKFDGTPLFPERKAYTVNYTLSDIEAALYEAVTHYVQTEMGKADQLAGLAQRLGRLRPHRPSAPPRLQPGGHLPVAQAPQGAARKPPARGEARHPRPAGARRDARPTCPRTTTTSTPRSRRTSKRRSSIEATAAKTIAELEAEIVILQGLEQQAKAVVASGQDRKWDELSKILQNNPEMRDAVGPAAQAHHLLRAPRHAELPARARSPACSATPTPSSPSTAAPTATSADASRRSSAPTPTCACWSPPTPPAKA